MVEPRSPKSLVRVRSSLCLFTRLQVKELRSKEEAVVLRRKKPRKIYSEKEDYKEERVELCKITRERG